MKVLFLSAIILLSFLGSAQQRYYSDPLKIPMLLSGSFAELRSNHFHSGIDIKTQGVTGLPVYAVADGYISRIVVSPVGYGKALYINHPNGTTTVYGHLDKFSAEIESYVQNKQYEKKSFRIDLEIPNYMFPVKQDDEIARSGNSGSSGGPHLHFEIRDTKTEEPLNPLKQNFPVVDNVAPKIFSVLVVPLTTTSHVNFTEKQQSYPLVFYDGKYHLKNNPVIPVWGEIGIAIQANDYFDGTYNKCGINLLRMSVDDEEQFTFQLNRFAFQNSRFINSHIVFDEYKSTKRRFIKTWLEPGNKLPIYNHNGNNGILFPENGKKQKIEIEIQDTYGNSTFLQFTCEGKKQPPLVAPLNPDAIFHYNCENTFETDSIKVFIPKGALYNDFSFEYHSELSSDDFFTDYHFIHNEKVPLHTNATIALKVDSIPEHLQEKVVMVNVNEFTGEYYAEGGSYEHGWVKTKTRNLGTYAVVVDTIAPSITPLSIKDESLTESGRIRFKIEDDLSGIKNIEGFLDGKWALFEYDQKKARITHYFDQKRFEMGKRHNLKLTITDYRGNKVVYATTFWK